MNNHDGLREKYFAKRDKITENIPDKSKNKIMTIPRMMPSEIIIDKQYLR